MKVVVTAAVYEFLENLVITLYKQEYFGFEEDARKYVDELYDDITQTLPTRLKKPAPQHYDKYGSGLYYVIFKKSKRTSWYAFFRIYQKDGERYYQVRHIGNNHTEAQHL
ncbi:MAG: hypothetical protein FWG79_08720 [Bacteroidales bacterium]|nr:hypothetical protein [Bacteroidales bacterium]